jgi:hypothetical protein
MNAVCPARTAGESQGGPGMAYRCVRCSCELQVHDYAQGCETALTGAFSGSGGTCGRGEAANSWRDQAMPLSFTRDGPTPIHVTSGMLSVVIVCPLASLLTSKYTRRLDSMRRGAVMNRYYRWLASVRRHARRHAKRHWAGPGADSSWRSCYRNSLRSRVTIENPSRRGGRAALRI